MQELTKRQQTNRENNKREIEANKQMKNIKKLNVQIQKQTEKERDLSCWNLFLTVMFARYEKQTNYKYLKFFPK